jgi:hypothetical protein
MLRMGEVRPPEGLHDLRPRLSGRARAASAARGHDPRRCGPRRGRGSRSEEPRARVGGRPRCRTSRPHRRGAWPDR